MRLNGEWSQEIHWMMRGNILHDPPAQRLWVGLWTKITQEEEHSPMASWKNILGLFLLEPMLRGGMSNRGNNDRRPILWETIQLTSEQRMWPFLTDVENKAVAKTWRVPAQIRPKPHLSSLCFSTLIPEGWVHTLYRTLRSPITLPWECTCSLGLFPLTDTILWISVGMTTSQISSVDKSWVNVNMWI